MFMVGLTGASISTTCGKHIVNGVKIDIAISGVKRTRSSPVDPSLYHEYDRIFISRRTDSMSYKRKKEKVSFGQEKGPRHILVGLYLFIQISQAIFTATRPRRDTCAVVASQMGKGNRQLLSFSDNVSSSWGLMTQTATVRFFSPLSSEFSDDPRARRFSKTPRS